uniref:BZIP domain-containing protein n=1 Tax=Panagrolaimus davidi TaxID=227884 RepID=A0A914Q8Y8_9BILA
MVRIYCLTRIITEELFIANKISGIDYGNDAEIFPDDNTKAALEKIKNDANIFKSYKLTELSIGYHLFGNEKVYYLLIFRKDSGLFVFKMIIKNTSVRGITEEETKYYEKVENDIKNLCGDNQDLQESVIEKLNFDLPLQSGQKVLRQKISDIRTSIELLCDERNGSVGNIVENARYNQKAHCDRLTDNSKKAGRRSSRKRSFSSAALSDSFDDSTYDNTILESDDISEDNHKTRGRPAVYSNSEQRRHARICASKKYTENKKAKFEVFKKEVKLLEMENQNLIRQYQNLFVEFGHKMPDNERIVVEDILIEKNNFETSINDRLKTMTFSSPPKDCPRKEKQKILVRRVRERQKAERIIAEEKYNFFCKQNSELREEIEAIDKLGQWIKSAVNNAYESNMVARNNSKVETFEIERSKPDELEKEHRFNATNFQPINVQESVTNIPELNEHQTIFQSLPNNPSPTQINIQDRDDTIKEMNLSLLFPKPTTTKDKLERSLRMHL